MFLFSSLPFFELSSAVVCLPHFNTNLPFETNRSQTIWMNSRFSKMKQPLLLDTWKCLDFQKRYNWAPYLGNWGDISILLGKDRAICLGDSEEIKYFILNFLTSKLLCLRVSLPFIYDLRVDRNNTREFSLLIEVKDGLIAQSQER